ncbi:CE1759 family FMN reductase [Streptomyces cylindrosporus]|uniref:NAD(P)H-dependent oxidoreductase n=1 Tax=Streptomyces cylindrosporus TaxID=2927583 RepID=A0ABS9Y0B5_9ACTN|nr:CE1759 family FMN reductase [Streptomyces cylindrosporus]MCI3270652.1 NAD(P)H-dependent oxidoreductase [Streptomyces cylindrosporus]
MTTDIEEPRTIVVVSAGVSDPSSSRLLADRLAQKTHDLLHAHGIESRITTIELRTLVDEIGRATVAGFVGEGLRPAIEHLAAADAVITATPVYKAGVSGLFKSFVDLLDNDLLIAKPVAVTATAGSARHALVPDEQMRPLFAYMRALVTPTALFAAPEDWGDGALGDRIARAATELAALIESGVSRSVVDGTWSRYQHQFGSSAQRSGRAVEPGEIDFDTDLMRLATGGRATAAAVPQRS